MSGALTNTGALNLTGTGTKVLTGTLNQTGPTTWTAGALELDTAAAFNNQAGSVFDDQADLEVTHNDDGYHGNPGVFTNAGTFRKSAGTGVTTFNGGVALNNSGIIQVQTGTVNFASGFIQTAGSTILSGGTLSGTLIDIQGGTLSGSGTINAAVRNAGEIDPGGSTAGQLTITGNYTQTSTGVLNIDLGGLTPGTQHDQLVITGTATLDGILNITLINAFMPKPGDIFTILAYASETGVFTTINGLDLGGGRTLVANYGTKNLTLSAQ